MKLVRLSALRTGRLYPRRYFWYSFLYRLSRPHGNSAAGRLKSIKYPNDAIGNRTRDLTFQLVTQYLNQMRHRISSPGWLNLFRVDAEVLPKRRNKLNLHGVRTHKPLFHEWKYFQFLILHTHYSSSYNCKYFIQNEMWFHKIIVQII
jgi:hypothetical protein